MRVDLDLNGKESVRWVSKERENSGDTYLEDEASVILASHQTPLRWREEDPAREISRRPLEENQYSFIHYSLFSKRYNLNNG